MNATDLRESKIEINNFETKATYLSCSIAELQ